MRGRARVEAEEADAEPVLALDPINPAQESELEKTLALTLDIVGMAGRYPSLRNAFQRSGKELAPHAIRADRDLRIALRAVGCQIRRDRARMVETDHRAARRFRNHVAVDQRGAGAGHD